tara:strand:+ start:412 stop:513 length:102 start_codon:yes stop_codon:yes gene_type:complete
MGYLPASYKMPTQKILLQQQNIVGCLVKGKERA